MMRRTARTILASMLLAAMLLTGGGTVATAAGSANCVGQHVSAMAQTYGGMQAATNAHNAMHGTDLSVGEHQAHIRSEMCGR